MTRKLDHYIFLKGFFLSQTAFLPLSTPYPHKMWVNIPFWFMFQFHMAAPRRGLLICNTQNKGLLWKQGAVFQASCDNKSNRIMIFFLSSDIRGPSIDCLFLLPPVV